MSVFVLLLCSIVTNHKPSYCFSCAGLLIEFLGFTEKSKTNKQKQKQKQKQKKMREWKKKIIKTVIFGYFP